MQSYIVETICKTGIFIICAQVLVHFRPNASYDKYLKMLVSAMILIQLFMPVSELFTGSGEQSLAKRVAWFEEELARRMDGAVEDYEADIAALEEEMQEGLQIETVFNEETLSQAQEQNFDWSVTPVGKIQIRIGKGDETYADISSGDFR